MMSEDISSCIKNALQQFYLFMITEDKAKANALLNFRCQNTCSVSLKHVSLKTRFFYKLIVCTAFLKLKTCQEYLIVKAKDLSEIIDMLIIQQTSTPFTFVVPSQLHIQI